MCYNESDESVIHEMWVTRNGIHRVTTDQILGVRQRHAASHEVQPEYRRRAILPGNAMNIYSAATFAQHLVQCIKAGLGGVLGDALKVGDRAISNALEAEFVRRDDTGTLPDVEYVRYSLGLEVVRRSRVANRPWAIRRVIQYT